MPIHPGTVFQTVVEKSVFGGDGLARLEGKVVFVSGVLAGEQIIAEVVEDKRDFIRAKLRELVVASPERIEPACPYAGRCAGCTYSNASFRYECAAKLEQFRDFIREVDPAIAETATFATANPEAQAFEFYRNKIKLQMRKAGGTPQLGYTFGDGRVTAIASCRIASHAINEKLAELLATPGFLHTLHDKMSVTFRDTPQDGVVYFRNEPGKKIPMLRQRVLDRDFMVPPGGFFQVNELGMKQLLAELQKVLERRPVAEVVDAYCGAGLFGFAAALSGVKKLLGIELDAAAAEAAKINWKQTGAEFRILSGAAEKGLATLLESVTAPEQALLILDPPRGGLEAKTIHVVADGNIQQVIYISCYPTTLVRDLQRFAKRGLFLKYAAMVNMFPRSGHFECFTLLERK